jgi:hypothetical protein
VDLFPFLVVGSACDFFMTHGRWRKEMRTVRVGLQYACHSVNQEFTYIPFTGYARRETLCMHPAIGKWDETDVVMWKRG